MTHYFQECRCVPIGEGSNLLFLTNFHGIILFSELRSIELLGEDDQHVDYLVGSGVHWDDFVQQMTDQGLGGIENLSLIPGQVGAAAIQNIGAYGVEICQRIQAVHTFHRRTAQERIFTRDECAYAYRHSLFKEPDYEDYIITHVHLRLDKHPSLQLDYADLRERITQRHSTPTPTDVRREVIAIRESKLPDPKVIGSAGSFFMNPVVEASVYEALREQYPHAPHYPLPDGRIKVPAGWLIDTCGLKGYRLGHAGVYERQALVLINADGQATGQEIARLAEYIQQQVQARFGIHLEPEVRYIV